MQLQTTDLERLEVLGDLTTTSKRRRSRNHIGWMLSPAIDRVLVSREHRPIAEPEPAIAETVVEPPPTEPVPLAAVEFSDYPGLLAALIEWRERRDISFELLNEIAGAPRGYFEKICAPSAVRRLGMQSLGWALGALGVRCVMIDDPAARAKVESRFEARDNPHLRSAISGGRTARVANAIAPELKALGLSDQAIESLARRAVQSIPKSRRKRHLDGVSASITARLFGWPAP